MPCEKNIIFNIILRMHVNFLIRRLRAGTYSTPLFNITIKVGSIKPPDVLKQGSHFRLKKTLCIKEPQRSTH